MQSTVTWTEFRITAERETRTIEMAGTHMHIRRCISVFETCTYISMVHLQSFVIKLNKYVKVTSNGVTESMKNQSSSSVYTYTTQLVW